MLVSESGRADRAHGSSTQHASLIPGRIPSLDGLRAISIALVVLGHAGQSFGFPEWLRFASHDAAIGVRIFFVISGFLITTLLMKEYARTQTVDLRSFYVRRAYRILPAAITAVAGITLIWRQPISEALRSLFFV